MHHLSRKLGWLAGLFSALLFVWMTGLHSQTQLKLSQLPIEVRMNTQDFCGDVGDTFGWGGNCPICNVEDDTTFDGPTPVHAVQKITHIKYVQRMVAVALTASNWTRVPVRAPPKFTA